MGGYRARKYGFHIKHRSVFFRGTVIAGIGESMVRGIGAKPCQKEALAQVAAQQQSSSRRGPKTPNRLPSPSKTMRNILQKLEDEDRWLERLYDVLARKHAKHKPYEDWPSPVKS